MTNDSGMFTGARTPVQRAALIVGAAFLLVGILGFIPGITTNYDMLEWGGHESGAKLLGIFEVSVLHNIVHLLFGVVGIAAARAVASAKWYLIVGGVVYLVLWLYGLVIDHDSDANFVPVNTADNWLHLALGVVMIALGAALTRRPANTPLRNTPVNADDVRSRAAALAAPAKTETASSATRERRSPSSR